MGNETKQGKSETKQAEKLSFRNKPPLPHTSLINTIMESVYISSSKQLISFKYLKLFRVNNQSGHSCAKKKKEKEKTI